MSVEIIDFEATLNCHLVVKLLPCNLEGTFQFYMLRSALLAKKCDASEFDDYRRIFEFSCGHNCEI